MEKTEANNPVAGPISALLADVAFGKGLNSRIFCFSGFAASHGEKGSTPGFFCLGRKIRKLNSFR